MQVELVAVENCPNLVLKLDLINLNASQVQLSIRKCNKITINSIFFETDFSRNQVFKISFVRVPSVELKNLYIDVKLQLWFQTVKSVNISDCTFRKLTQDDISLSDSGPICLANTILHLSSTRRPQPLSKCPWIKSISNNSLGLLPAKETSLSLSILPKLSKSESVNEYVLITPSISVMFLMTVCIITTIIIIILIISIKELVTRNNSYQQQHSTYVRNDSWLNNEDLVQSSSSCDSDEVRESRIQKSDLLDLRRSISAVLLYNQNKSCRRSNSTTFKNVILAKEEEFLC